MSHSLFQALFCLKDPDAIPELELEGSTLSVHLTSDRKMRTAWPSEITIPVSEPWHEGEEKLVDLRIEAKPFSDYVRSWNPPLYVCRNRRIIGYLRLRATSKT